MGVNPNRISSPFAAGKATLEVLAKTEAERVDQIEVGRVVGAPIRIATRDQGQALADTEPGTAVMWQSVRYEGACAANSLCATTAFFCSDDHLSAWRRDRSAPSLSWCG